VTAVDTELVRWRPAPALGAPRVVELSPMLVNVLDSLCEGKSNKQVKDDWGISEDTVKTHIKRLLRALDARDRLHAAVLVWSGAVEIRRKPVDPRWAKPPARTRPAEALTAVGEYL
jgi:DNA-binding NarL/FixJ family response regulator